MATGLLLLALSKLLLREFFELLEATYTKISTLSSSFLNERAGETIASPSRRARQKGCARRPSHFVSSSLCVFLLLMVIMYKCKQHKEGGARECSH